MLAAGSSMIQCMIRWSLHQISYDDHLTISAYLSGYFTSNWYWHSTEYNWFTKQTVYIMGQFYESSMVYHRISYSNIMQLL